MYNKNKLFVGFFKAKIYKNIFILIYNIKI